MEGCGTWINNTVVVTVEEVVDDVMAGAGACWVSMEENSSRCNNNFKFSSCARLMLVGPTVSAHHLLFLLHGQSQSGGCSKASLGATQGPFGGCNSW